jgi:Kef-type K+ transport system membrane component KefB
MVQWEQFLESTHALTFVGGLLIAAYVGGYLANRVKAPRVTGYLITGIVVGPSLTGLLPELRVAGDLQIITEIALGVIAFLIGGSLEISKVRKVGSQIVYITAAQAAGAYLAAAITAIALFPSILAWTGGPDIPWSTLLGLALVMGAISTATAPAAVLAIIHEYKARGVLTTMLLGVVALDDALAIFFFAFSASIADSVVNQGAANIRTVLISPLGHLGISVVLGMVMGLILRRTIPFVVRRDSMLTVLLGCVAFVSGLAITLHASPILANMIFGFIVVNFVEHHADLFEVVESIEEPLFAMFFALAGAHMNLSTLAVTGALAVTISISRFAGKIGGSWLGAAISGAPGTVRKYLGLALLPKAGVTVGLILEAGHIFRDSGLAVILISGVIGSTIIDELVTPFIARHALSQAGETTRIEEGP